MVGFAKIQKYMETKNSSSSDSKSWGGARQGSGRKAVEHGKNFSFRSTPAVEKFLLAYDGNKNKFINDAIEHYIDSLR